MSNVFLISHDSCDKEEDEEKKKHQDFLSAALTTRPHNRVSG